MTHTSTTRSPAPAIPFPPQPNNVTQLQVLQGQVPSLAAQVDQRQWPPGKGFWIGIAFLIFFTIIVVSIYSYLASPFWFGWMKELCGFPPSKHTPISRRPIPNADLESGDGGAGGIEITRPEAAHLSSSPSKDPLPQYWPGSNFSHDVLSGLLDLNMDAAHCGSRPPSYRSRLTLDVELMSRS
ncbi:hypothetical protein PV08_07574 [Exophiala spinifera]|uniref:Uncharacterized protein n=1 Tax=Exophiala spinifera TaxID=91928 RepID=A0A0D2BU28_9EURO|nr:uncharacterized protein PV08_07574 [Exophiala spinifera]KIW14789.1 hypothetical protein PV08_07574 [Exophiala spinifera]